MPTPRRLLRLVAFGVLPGLLLVALVGAALCRGGDGTTSRAPAPSPAPPRTFDALTPTPAADAGEQAAEVTPEPPRFPTPREDARLTRLIIPAAKVNAPLQTKGVNARNEMENPDGKDNVAWYNFTARPGFGSNAVFSGHVDWLTGEIAVFWYLRDVKAGDEVMIRLSDGMELKYRVTSNEVYAANAVPVAEIIGPTTNEVITLITCDGVFDRRSQDYDKRRVVRAERVG
jgi:LPXTG-site transpeptidase (sortase) family protein